MSDSGFRLIGLNGLLIILLGMFAGGIPLTILVTHDVYGQMAGVHVGGDYRAWMMAHLEGLLNGLLIIAIAAVTRVRPMASGRERLLMPSLLVAAWGNAAASVAAPVLGVRGMTFDAGLANNLVALTFTVALIASVIAMAIAIVHLAGRDSAR